jgi:hypothetical protein
LLFLKAALDNDQSLSNFAVPFDEDNKAFKFGPNDSKPPHMLNKIRKGISTAPVDVTGKR